MSSRFVICDTDSKQTKHKTFKKSFDCDLSTDYPMENTHFIPSSDDFLSLLNEHAIVDISALPQESAEIQEFIQNYKQHCASILVSITSKDFFSFHGIVKQFWASISASLRCSINCAPIFQFVELVDDILYQSLVHLLINDVLESIPLGITQSIRHFAKTIENSLLSALEAYPIEFIQVKINCAKRFANILKRRTSLNHLAQAVRTVLSSEDQIKEMLSDWTQIDFECIKEQSEWVLKCKSPVNITDFENSFKAYFKDGASLELWAQWMENTMDQFMEISTEGTLTESACRTFLLKWSFFSALFMRDLTLRSATSFGSFHLLRLFFEEFIVFTIEKRLSDRRIENAADTAMTESMELQDKNSFIRAFDEIENRQNYFDDKIKVTEALENALNNLQTTNLLSMNENGSSKKKIRLDSSLAAILNC